MQRFLAPEKISSKLDLIIPLALILVCLAIYSPILYSNYLYTDEAPQLWLTCKNVNLTSVAQGRYITYLIFRNLFSFIHSVSAVRTARIVSLAGWCLCLPIWYLLIKRLLQKSGLPTAIALFYCWYLVCMPAFTISIGWSACLEMFLACTAGLVSGFAFQIGMDHIGKEHRAVVTWITASLVAVIISLFTYQNGFGCFFIAPLIPLISSKQIGRQFIYAMVCAVLIYLIYFVLFKLSLIGTTIAASSRTHFAGNPFYKFEYFFARVLPASFHLTCLIAEKSATGLVFYFIAASLWLLSTLNLMRSYPLHKILGYFGAILVILIFAYVPSLIVTENYASNRTLFSINFFVFILISATICEYFKQPVSRYGLILVLMLLFTINAWYNLRYEFIYRLQHEYAVVKEELLNILIINPLRLSSESFFVKIRLMNYSLVF